jgi:FtsH-binding integral membrane protein
MAFKKVSLEAVADSVANAEVSDRASFLMKTYAHLTGAVFAWVFLMVLMHLTLSIDAKMTMLGWMSGYSIFLVLGAFVLASMVAHKWAASGASGALQYAGLGLYVVIEALFVYPMVFYASAYAGDPNVLPVAAGLTLALFAGLTAIVFITRKDFSFLRGVLGLSMLLLFGVFVAGMIFKFTLGILFISALVGLMCGYILYETSAVLHHFRSDQYVSASLVLFASLATLFYYILQLVMMFSGGGDD